MVQENSLPACSSPGTVKPEFCSFSLASKGRKDGVPLVGYNFTEENIHALYPGYGYIAWEFAKHYSRNQETGAIEYHK